MAAAVFSETGGSTTFVSSSFSELHSTHQSICLRYYARQSKTAEHSAFLSSPVTVHLRTWVDSQDTYLGVLDSSTMPAVKGPWNSVIWAVSQSSKALLIILHGPGQQCFVIAVVEMLTLLAAVLPWIPARTYCTHDNNWRQTRITTYSTPNTALTKIATASSIETYLCPAMISRYGCTLTSRPQRTKTPTSIHFYVC